MAGNTVIDALGKLGLDTSLQQAAEIQAQRAASRTASASARKETFQKFEAMVLQNFVQNILPEDSESVYGEGIAGDMWKSFLATEIAGQMAKSGGIGIASRILADHYKDGETTVAVKGVVRDPAQPARDEQSRLSTSLVQELQRRITRDIGGDLTGSTNTGVFADT